MTDGNWGRRADRLFFCVADLAELAVCVHRVWIVTAQRLKQLFDAIGRPQVSRQLTFSLTPALASQSEAVGVGVELTESRRVCGVMDDGA